MADDESQATGGASLNPAISEDGLKVVFSSTATNLVAGDTNNLADVFLRDQLTGATTRVSVASDGSQGAGGHSQSSALSGDGLLVAFQSGATNLVGPGGDTNGCSDIFVRNRPAGTTTRVSVTSTGTQANGYSVSPAISTDGRFVAFESAATNLVTGDTNGFPDIFVHDRQTGATSRVNINSNGTQADSVSSQPALSGDGRFVAFESAATNLVTGDTNGCSDIFVHDRQTGITTRINVNSEGTQADDSGYSPALSVDGRYVAFDSYASNLVAGDTNSKADIFVHDRQTGATSRVSLASDGTQADGNSLVPSLSADGRCVAFVSNATNLVASDTNGKADAFVRDWLTGTCALASVASDGTQGSVSADETSLSADGRYLAFVSAATALVSGDTNGLEDVFVHRVLFP